MNWMNQLKVMPLLVVVAALAFGVRFGEFVSGAPYSSGRAQAQSVAAPEEVVEAVAENEEETVGEQLGSIEPEPLVQGGPVSVAASNTSSPTQASEESIEWKDSTDSDLEFSEVRMELFEDLSARRQDLQNRERELSVREALLKAAEQEIDQKYKELVSLRSEIQDLLVEQSEEEQKRVASLVKIYEGMKPKDAARIFNTLDLDILLQVVSQMSERKSAPIIASMTPDRARTLTTLLMEQKTLPDLSDDNFLQQ